MINKLLSPNKELLVSVVPKPNGEVAISHARMDGRRIVAVGKGLPSRVGTPVRASVFSLDSHFEQVEDLKANSVKMLPLAARRYLDAELVYEDEAYRLRALPLTVHERTITAELAALPEADLEAAIAALPLAHTPGLQMVPAELAIAALVGKVTRDPVIVFWERDRTLVSLLLDGGTVRMRMRERIMDESRQTLIDRAHRGLLASLGQGEDAERCPVLYAGDLCGSDADLEDSESRVLKEQLIGLYRTRKDVPPEVILQQPELFGLPLVDSGWNFLGPDYQNQVRAWQYARPAAAVAACVGIGFALVGGFQHLQTMIVSAQFDNQRAELNGALGELERIRPADAEIAIVRNGLAVQRESVDELRLDRLLDWLTNALPEDVLIRQLEIMPAPVPREVRGAVPVSYGAGQKPFVVRMEMVLAETAFAAAEASSSRVVRTLSDRLHMVDNQLQIAAPEPGAARDMILKVSAQARAEDF